MTWLKSTLASINAFMTVPMYAALLSIFIAMIPPLQAWMAKIKPVEQAIRSAGACSSESFDTMDFFLLLSRRSVKSFCGLLCLGSAMGVGLRINPIE